MYEVTFHFRSNSSKTEKWSLYKCHQVFGKTGFAKIYDGYYPGIVINKIS